MERGAPLLAARPAYGLVPKPISRILLGAANGAVIFISLGQPEGEPPQADGLRRRLECD